MPTVPVTPRFVKVAWPATEVAVVVPTRVAPLLTVAVTTAVEAVIRLPLESTTEIMG